MSTEPPLQEIQKSLHHFRDRWVMLDTDLAAIHGVATSALNQSVIRNQSRFPEDFAFLLTESEWASLKSQIVIPKMGRGGRRSPPRVLTEHGALMASTLLRSKQAVAMSLFVIRAFVQMREQLASSREILKRLSEIDRTLLLHDRVLAEIYTKLQPLLSPAPEPPKRRIGFQQNVPTPISRRRFDC